MANVFSKILAGVGVVLAVPMCHGMHAATRFPSLLTTMKELDIAVPASFPPPPMMTPLTDTAAPASSPPPPMIIPLTGIAAPVWQSPLLLPVMYTPFRTRTKYGEGIEARQTRDLLNRPEMASCRGYVRNENSFVWQLFARYFDFNTASCQKLRKVTHNAIKISKINGAELPGLGHAIVRTEAFIVKYIEDHLSRMSELFPLLTREGDIPEEIQARLN